MGRHKAPFPKQLAFKKLGTLCHNRQTTIREITVNCGVTRGVVKQWAALGLIEKVLPTEYPAHWFPTKKGWDFIEEKSNATS